MGATRELATFVATTTFDALPAEVVHQTKRCWLDVLGAALGGSRMPPIDHLLAVADALGGGGSATVLGRGRRLDALWASRVNGQAAHVLDFDDTLVAPGAVLHPSAPVVPAVLALGEWQRRDGRQALRAAALGIEVAVRSALAFGQSHIDRAFHATGTAGALGTAAAGAALLGLDAARTGHALGVAASQAAGLRCFHGSMTKSFQAGHAASSGLLAVLLAERGWDSSDAAYESERGMASAMTAQLDVDALVGGLGQRWGLLRVGFKPYPCGVVTHPIIDAMLALRDQGLRAEEVERVDLAVHPHVISATGKTELHTELDAKFSVYHCAAVALVDGQVSLAQFERARIDDPAVVVLRRRVTTTVTPGLARDQTRVTVTLRDGRQLGHAVAHGSGTEQNPLTDEQLARKFRGLADRVVGAERAARLAEHVWRLEQLADIGELAALGA